MLPYVAAASVPDVAFGMLCCVVLCCVVLCGVVVLCCVALLCYVSYVI